MEFNKALNETSNSYKLEASTVFSNHWCGRILLLRLKIVEVWSGGRDWDASGSAFRVLSAPVSGKCRF